MIGDVASWIFSEHGLAALAMVLAAYRLIRGAWSAKEVQGKRTQQIANVARLAFAAAEGVASATGAEKANQYLAFVQRMAAQTGLGSLSEKDLALAQSIGGALALATKGGKPLPNVQIQPATHP